MNHPGDARQLESFLYTMKGHLEAKRSIYEVGFPEDYNG
jgi:hypothetical protein